MGVHYIRASAQPESAQRHAAVSLDNPLSPDECLASGGTQTMQAADWLKRLDELSPRVAVALGCARCASPWNLGPIGNELSEHARDLGMDGPHRRSQGLQGVKVALGCRQGVVIEESLNVPWLRAKQCMNRRNGVAQIVRGDASEDARLPGITRNQFLHHKVAKENIVKNDLYEIETMKLRPSDVPRE